MSETQLLGDLTDRTRRMATALGMVLWIARQMASGEMPMEKAIAMIEEIERETFEQPATVVEPDHAD